MQSQSSEFQGSSVELKEIINNSWDGICIIDKKTNFIYMNDALSPMLGYSKEELTQNPFLFFVEKNFQAVFLQLLRDNIENSYNTDANVVCTRKDKKPIYLKMTVSLMTNKKYFVVNAKDITKEISDDEILNNYVLSLHLDMNENITKVSNAFCKLTGYQENMLINKEFYDLKHTEMRNDVFNDKIQSLKEKTKNNEAFHLATIKGDPFHVDTKMKSIHNKYGDTIGYTLLMFDITKELLLDQQLSIENSKLNIMGETITTISHEWRQPLNIISLKAQTLQFSIEDDDSIKLLDEIQDKAKELSGTIENFQNIIKIKSSKIKISMDEIIDKSIAYFTQNVSKNVEFKKQGGFDKEVELYEKELSKILHSLYLNSFDAFNRHAIEDAKIVLDVYSKNNTIHINLIDNAGGIDKEVLPRIYEPYFSTKDERHGVGLGLYMTKTIIQMHLGGTIDIENIKDGVFIKIKIPYS